MRGASECLRGHADVSVSPSKNDWDIAPLTPAVNERQASYAEHHRAARAKTGTKDASRMLAQGGEPDLAPSKPI